MNGISSNSVDWKENAAYATTYAVIGLAMASAAKAFHLTGLTCLAFVPGLILPQLKGVRGKILSHVDASRAQMIGFASLIAFALLNLIVASK